MDYTVFELPAEFDSCLSKLTSKEYSTFNEFRGSEWQYRFLCWSLFYSSYLEWCVFPSTRNKVPYVKFSQIERPPSFQVLHDWAKQFPSANVTLRTGIISGIIVLDIDCKDFYQDGFETLHNYPSLPDTVSAITPNNGAHYFFKHDCRLVHSMVGSKGIDRKAEMGCITIYPSVNSDNREYLWEIACEPWYTTMASIPDWVCDLQSHFQGDQLWDMANLVDGSDVTLLLQQGVPKGQRHDQLVTILGHLATRDDLTYDNIRDMIWTWDQCNSPPMTSNSRDNRDFENTIQDCLTKWRRNAVTKTRVSKPIVLPPAPPRFESPANESVPLLNTAPELPASLIFFQDDATEVYESLEDIDLD